mmetsp:Transcript_57183/g.134592  ORF Transcript_57183/g.134592 Transcript_57183/m.134592 type:complete len:251 (+) Transcript_57183:929-1681(+)
MAAVSRAAPSPLVASSCVCSAGLSDSTLASLARSISVFFRARSARKVSMSFCASCKSSDVLGRVESVRWRSCSRSVSSLWTLALASLSWSCRTDVASFCALARECSCCLDSFWTRWRSNFNCSNETVMLLRSWLALCSRISRYLELLSARPAASPSAAFPLSSAALARASSFLNSSASASRRCASSSASRSACTTLSSAPDASMLAGRPAATGAGTAAVALSSHSVAFCRITAHCRRAASASRLASSSSS